MLAGSRGILFINDLQTLYKEIVINYDPVGAMGDYFRG